MGIDYTLVSRQLAIGDGQLAIGYWRWVEGAESGTHELVTLLKEQDGGYGGVYSARHTYEDTLGHAKGWLLVIGYWIEVKC